MYVFYPASRLVGLTINYREINQANPFPARNPSPSEEDPGLRGASALAVRKSPSPVAKRSKSESPRRNSRKSPDGEPTLEEYLKNLEVYRARKPAIKRSWSLHFRKTANSPEIAKMAAMECTLREMTHPALNETLKAHNSVTFKLVKTGKFFPFHPLSVNPNPLNRSECSHPVKSVENPGLREITETPPSFLFSSGNFSGVP